MRLPSVPRCLYSLIALLVVLISAGALQPAYAVVTPPDYRELFYGDRYKGVPATFTAYQTAVPGVARWVMPHFFAAGGPCAGLQACLIENYVVVPLRGTMTESVIRAGRYWNFDYATKRPWISNGSTLNSVARYQAGVCRFQSFPCKMKARGLYTNLTGLMREETALDLGNHLQQWWFYDLNGLLLKTCVTSTITIQGGLSDCVRP